MSRQTDRLGFSDRATLEAREDNNGRDGLSKRELVGDGGGSSMDR